LTEAARCAFPVVALGASAGGLEAYERFFAAMPVDSGMAFVVVQHLDPTHVSMLVELLQRATAMPVVKVEDQMPLLPDRVHVCPPHSKLGLVQGRLQLAPTADTPSPQRPIDDFFRALALDQGPSAVAIVLSGNGNDGTLGLRAVADARGRCLIQDPATARNDGMPRSAIDSGVQAQVLLVEAMPAALAQAWTQPSDADDTAPQLLDSPAALQHILTQLRSATGHDFFGYKRSTIARRVARRMAAIGLSDPAAYAARMKEQPAEAKALFHELLINVTRFFRDPPAFEVIRAQVLPGLLAALGEERVLRVWVAGCATGEEAYSIAILLREAMDEDVPAFRVQVYATDLDEEAIAVARAGRYPKAIAQDLGPERLKRFFAEATGGWRVRREIREMVVFAVQSVIKDPPFTRLDLVSCRNLMIYLESDLQERLLRTFHYALKPGGVLLLSPSEGIAEHGDLFDCLDRTWKFFRARAAVPASLTVLRPPANWSPGTATPTVVDTARRTREPPLAEFSRRSMLGIFVPVSVVIDRQGTVLYVHGETGPYLRPAPGLPTHDILALAEPALQAPLREAVEEVTRHGHPIATRSLVFTPAIGGQMALQLTVRHLPVTEQEVDLLLVSFQPAEPAATARAGRRLRAGSGAETRRILELEGELQAARQSITAVREERQAAILELRAANEELQSTNEELQSTNEELETSKEELQSLNEELSTVNAELHSKLEQMSDMQDDMKNLLDSIHLGIVFLDSALRIRRFTRDAMQIYRLQGTDIGRALADIRSELQGEDLLGDARRVLESLVPVEREVSTAAGKRYLGRIQPYRTVDNVIDGVVLTFADVTERERVREVAARGARVLAQAIVEVVPTPLLVLDGQLTLVTANQAWFATFGGMLSDTTGKRLFDIGDGIWDTAVLRDALHHALTAGEALNGWLYALPGTASSPTRTVRLSLRRIGLQEAATDLVLLVAAPEALPPARDGGLVLISQPPR
jgi:two-component system CheB/CheR fusion protein